MSHYYHGYNSKKLEEQFNMLDTAIKSELERASPRKEVVQQLQVHTSRFADVISEAKDFAKAWNKKLEDVALEHHITEEYGSSYSQLFFEVLGLETDMQYHSRLWQNYEAACMQEERERKEYERLSKKFLNK